MKIDKITVNKTDEQPDGVEIQIIKPEDDLQGRVLSYLLVSQIREARRAGKIPYELPDQFTVEHKGEGTFIVSGNVGQGEYYHPARPLAIVGIQTRGNRFDMIHAQISTDNMTRPETAQTPDAPDAPATAQAFEASPSVEAESTTESDKADT